ncbi:Pentatricopeptide repeat-containing protein [Platanthera guangdongensis]|uniref:Pentatricopeptide repeat-containing protein n=1 Tax=Platanthera guangdongensis TaxID=2320717 RepID=A0ABR2M574_9ASPA
MKESFIAAFSANNSSLHELPKLSRLGSFRNGEVDSFKLIPIAHVANIIRRTEFFKPNCSLCIIDFLFRHGVMNLARGERKLSGDFSPAAANVHLTGNVGQGMNANNLAGREQFSWKPYVDVGVNGGQVLRSEESRPRKFDVNMQFQNGGGDVPRAQNAYYASAPSFQPITNEYQHASIPLFNGRSISPSELPNQVVSGANSADNGERNGHIGTLEEFDQFVGEERVKDAMEYLESARSVHDHISMILGTNVGIMVYNKLLDAYIRCGSIADAYKLFEKMPQRNLTSWDTMIRGLAHDGLGEEAIDLFTRFKQLGLKPDGGMFNSVVSACRVIGAVDEGMLHFKSMVVDFGITPSMENYSSVVDMLGSCGYLNEAFEFIEKMPAEPTIDIWEILMNLCRANGDAKLGDRCADIIEHFDPTRLTEESKKGLLPVKVSDIKKKAKNSDTTELANRFCKQREYRAGERSHPEDDLVYDQIRGLLPQLKDAGYVPEIKCVLHDIDKESREEALLYHSERLALAYALMTTPARQTVRIMKNLRVCVDCHNALKIISKIVGRLVIARDAKSEIALLNLLLDISDGILVPASEAKRAHFTALIIGLAFRILTGPLGLRTRAGPSTMAQICQK